MNLDVQERTLENDKLLFENIDYSHCFEITDSKIKEENVSNENHLGDGQKIDNFHQDMHTQKPQKVQGKNCENYDSRCENVDCTPFSKTSDSMIFYMDNLRDNMETGLTNINQEVELNEESTEHLHPTFVNDSNLYIFENAHSNVHGKDNLDNSQLVEILHIKQEIIEHDEDMSNLTDKKDFQDVKYNLNVQDAEIKTEITDFRIPNDNREFEFQKIENSDCDVENNSVRIESSNLNPWNGTTTNEKSDCKLENCGTDIETYDFNEKKTDLNIENCDSGNGAVGCMQEESDSKMDAMGVHNHRFETDLQPTVMSKGLQGFVFNQGSPANQINESQSSCNPNDIPSSISSESEHTFRQEPQLEVERPYHCRICGKKFTAPNYLKSHILMTIHNKPLHKCNVCQKEFKHSFTLKRHMITHSNERPYKCNLCQKGLKYLHQVKCHMMSHSNERPYKCDICHRELKSLRSLQCHMITHSNEHPYKCDICHREFKRLRSLQCHMQTHSNEHPYKCDICHRELKTSGILKCHMQTHSNERPYKCDICQKGFKRSGNLKQHMVTHRNKQPYK